MTVGWGGVGSVRDAVEEVSVLMNGDVEKEKKLKKEKKKQTQKLSLFHLFRFTLGQSCKKKKNKTHKSLPAWSFEVN